MMRLRPVPSMFALGCLLACGTDAGAVAGSGGSGGSGGGSLSGDGGSKADGDAGGSTGGGGGSGGATADDGGACEVHDVGNGRIPPDMLIVLDRSGSMKSRNVNRWDPSVSGLKAITSSLDSNVNFGLMTFPGKGGGGATTMPTTQDCNGITDLAALANCLSSIGGNVTVGDTCAPGTVDVPVGAHQAANIAAALDSQSPGGATPTAASLGAAHTALGSGTSTNIDVPAAGKYVLLVTDGQPNCTGGNFQNGDPQAVMDSVAQIKAMADDGIKTYVLGYGTQSDAAATDALNQMAQAGGTGDTNYRPINDEASLLSEFQKITGQAVSCDFTLDSAPPDPTYVLVTLDGKQLNLDDPNGWSITSDHLHVTILGTACDAVKAKDGHLLSVRVQCDRVILR